MATTLPSRWVLHPLQVGQSTVLIGAATALGLWPDPKVGLDAPLLQRLVFAPRLAVAGGKTLDDLQAPAWQGLLASFYGAIPRSRHCDLG
jgi:hypothetical protein